MNEPKKNSYATIAIGITTLKRGSPSDNMSRLIVKRRARPGLWWSRWDEVTRRSIRGRARRCNPKTHHQGKDKKRRDKSWSDVWMQEIFFGKPNACARGSIEMSATAPTAPRAAQTRTVREMNTPVKNKYQGRNGLPRWGGRTQPNNLNLFLGVPSSGVPVVDVHSDCHLSMTSQSQLAKDFQIS